MIKKRRNRNIPLDPEDAGNKLVIVAAPKKPIPEKGIIRALASPNPTPQEVRRFGSVAKSVARTQPDEGMTVEDRVIAMRSSYDSSNPSEQRYRNRVRNRATAITAMCVTCQGGIKAVRECIDTTCPLWAFRLGGDPFYRNRK